MPHFSQIYFISLFFVFTFLALRIATFKYVPDSFGKNPPSPSSSPHPEKFFWLRLCTVDAHVFFLRIMNEIAWKFLLDFYLI